MTRFTIDPERSTATIEGRSSLHPIHSRATGLTGVLDCTFDEHGTIDLSRPVAGSVRFPVDRLQSSSPLETRELRRRIDARRHPTIDGEITAIEAAAAPGDYRSTGTVTFRGIARTYTSALTITLVDGLVHLSGRASFDVRDHGMEPPRILMLRVEPMVEVTIDVVATPDD